MSVNSFYNEKSKTKQYNTKQRRRIRQAAPPISAEANEDWLDLIIRRPRKEIDTEYLGEFYLDLGEWEKSCWGVRVSETCMQMSCRLPEWPWFMNLFLPSPNLNEVSVSGIQRRGLWWASSRSGQSRNSEQCGKWRLLSDLVLSQWTCSWPGCRLGHRQCNESHALLRESESQAQGPEVSPCMGQSERTTEERDPWDLGLGHIISTASAFSVQCWQPESLGKAVVRHKGHLLLT